VANTSSRARKGPAFFLPIETRHPTVTALAGLVNARLRGRVKSERCLGPIFKIPGVLKSPIKKRGETMTNHTIQNAGYRICDRAQRTRDYVLVSSFGLWAVLLGLSPVLAFRMLMAS
jgi:hypothetical protein